MRYRHRRLLHCTGKRRPRWSPGGANPVPRVGVPRLPSRSAGPDPALLTTTAGSDRRSPANTRAPPRGAVGSSDWGGRRRTSPHIASHIGRAHNRAHTPRSETPDRTAAPSTVREEAALNPPGQRTLRPAPVRCNTIVMLLAAWGSGVRVPRLHNRTITNNYDRLLRPETLSRRGCRPGQPARSGSPSRAHLRLPAGRVRTDRPGHHHR